MTVCRLKKVVKINTLRGKVMDMDKDEIVRKRKEKKLIKKREKQRKRKRKLVKNIVLFVIVQALFIGIFSVMQNQSRIATNENTQTIIGFAEDVFKSDLNKQLNIYFDSEAYRYGAGLFNQYSGDNLPKDLLAEKLYVKYYKCIGTYGFYNTIVDLRSETKTYYTMNDYNDYSRLARTESIIFFVFFEAIYLFVLIIYIRGLQIDHGEVIK